MACRQFDDFGHFSAEFALVTFFIEHIAALTQNLDALFHFLHAHHVAVVAVAVFHHHFIKFHLIVERIGMCFSHIAVET